MKVKDTHSTYTTKERKKPSGADLEKCVVDAKMFFKLAILIYFSTKTISA